MEAGSPVAQWGWVLMFWAVYFLIAAYLILRPEVVAQATGLLFVRYVDSTSPAWVMRFLGCGMLAYIPGRIVAVLTHLWWVGLLAGLALATVLHWAACRWRSVPEDPVDRTEW